MRDKLNEKVFVVPTDTVVGLISKSPNLIYEIKNRSSSKKLILFVNKVQDIKNLTPIELGILKKY
jgi:tRNA A37 threonylcarbamoyladenosine synthetase subunit TsaC/SUA5/YrdC